MPCEGSPPLHSGGQSHKWLTSGQGGYITPAAWRVPTTSERGAESQVAHTWARWLRNQCFLGVPTASERGARIRGDQQVGKVATYTLPPGGSPPHHSGGGGIRGGPQVGKVAT